MGESKKSFINFKSKDDRSDSVGGVLGMVDDIEVVGDSDDFDSELDAILNKGTALSDLDFGSGLSVGSDTADVVRKSEVSDVRKSEVSDVRKGSISRDSGLDGVVDLGVRAGVTSELVRLESCCDNQIRVDIDTLSQPFSVKRASIPVGYFHNFLGKIRKEADRYNIDLERSSCYLDFKRLYLDKLDMDRGFIFYFRTVAGLYTVVSSLNRLMSKIVDDLDLLRKDSFLRF